MAVVLAACGDDDDDAGTAATVATTSAGTAGDATAVTTGDTTGDTVAATTGETAATTGDTTAADVTVADVDTSGVTLTVGTILDTSKAIWNLAAPTTDYNVEWATFPTGPPLLQALDSGVVDLGQVGITAVVNAQLNGLDFVAVAETTTPLPGNRVIVPEGSDITSLEQLAGHTIAVPKGTAWEGFLVQALDSVGMTAADVQLVDLAQTDALPAFLNGDVDAWSVGPPQADVAVSEHGASVLIDGSGFPSTGYLATTEETLADPATAAAIADFLVQYRAALASATVPTLAAQIAEQNQVPEEVAALTATNLVGGVLGPITDSTYETYQSTIDLFATAGLVAGAPPDPLTVFSTDLNAALA
ncbi:MAG: ABC transporter substrate-binding protein [Ilumatobacteraceae bacterium]